MRELPPVLEVAVLELVRVDSSKAMPWLLSRLEDRKALARQRAALALAGIGGKQAALHLVKLCKDDDPWTHFAAQPGLRRRSGKDFACDWLFGTTTSRKAAVSKWSAWVGQLKH